MDRRAIDAAVIALARRNGMVVTTAQRHRLGVDRHLIESRQGRLLIRVAQGVYSLGAPTPEIRFRAALAAIPGSAASHHTAGRLHGLALVGAPVHDVLATRRTRLRIEGVRIRWTGWLPDDDLTRVAGLPATTVARTVCDLAGVVARARLRHLTELAVVEGRLNLLDLEACAAGYVRRGRTGSAAVLALGSELLGHEPIPASELERRAVRLFEASGLSGWVGQYQPPWYDGVRGVVDLAWPDLGIVVELDGRRWHATTQAQAEDGRRDRAAAAHGWVTLRFGWQEIVRRPGLVVEECRAVIEARRAGGRGQRAWGEGVG